MIGRESRVRREEGQSCPIDSIRRSANGSNTRIAYEDEIDPSYNFSDSDRRGEYRLSGGLKVRLINNWYTKVEYR